MPATFLVLLALFVPFASTSSSLRRPWAHLAPHLKSPSYAFLFTSPDHLLTISTPYRSIKMSAGPVKEGVVPDEKDVDPVKKGVGECRDALSKLLEAMPKPVEGMPVEVQHIESKFTVQHVQNLADQFEAWSKEVGGDLDSSSPSSLDHRLKISNRPEHFIISKTTEYLKKNFLEGLHDLQEQASEATKIALGSCENKVYTFAEVFQEPTKMEFGDESSISCDSVSEWSDPITLDRKDLQEPRNAFDESVKFVEGCIKGLEKSAVWEARGQYLFDQQMLV
ncbi:hypothetical protein F4780DRAFT_444819 [Xylariomycetidae sp. FL0641]|nr:hypothetical protein F4780DRAFT_444819 [Xylariomycetidae sp. FL0641]